MKTVIRKKREDEKIWLQELVAVKTFNELKRTIGSWWMCDRCRTVREPNDFAMKWEDEDGNLELHCPECASKMTYADEDYFRRHYQLKD